MKKGLCGLMAAVLLLMSVAVPVTHAEESGVTVFGFKEGRWGTGLETGVTEKICKDRFACVTDNNGTLTITYTVDEPAEGEKSAWAEYYDKHGMPKQTVGLERPDGAIKGAFIQVTDGTNVQEELERMMNPGSSIWRDSEGFWPQLDLLKIVSGTDGAELMTLDSTTVFYAAWLDADGNLIDVSDGNGKYIEKMTVVIEHTNEMSDRVTLPAIIPFDFDNGLGYGMGHDALNPVNYGSRSNTGIFHVDYIAEEKSIWENAVASGGTQKHNIGFGKPNGATEVAMMIADVGTAEEDVLAYFAQAQNWQDASDGDIMHQFPVFDYEVIDNGDGTASIKYIPVYPSFEVYLSWKNEDGPIDLGMGQYIARLKVEAAHENPETQESWTKDIGDQTVDSPYDFAVPLRSEILDVVIPGVDETCVEVDDSNLAEGKLTVRLNMTAEDWKKAYEAWNLPGIPMGVGIWVQHADELESVNILTTGKEPDEDLANYLTQISPGYAEGGRTELPHTIAEQTVNGTEVTVVPVGETHTTMLVWKLMGSDDAPCYNFGTLLHPVYVEYLTVTVEHVNQNAVKFTSDMSVDAGKITPNAHELPEKMFKRRHKYENDSLTYFVDMAEVQKAIEAEGLLEKYRVIRTFIEAPEGAVKVVLDGEVYELAERNGVKGVNIDDSILRQINDEETLVADSLRSNHTIRWIMQEDQEVVRKISVIINVIGESLWFENVYDAHPFEYGADGFFVTEELSGKNGVSIESVEGEPGHFAVRLSGSKIDYEALQAALKRQVLIKVPEDAVYYKWAGAGGSNYYLCNEMAENMMIELETEQMTEIEFDESVPGYMAVGRLPTVEQVSIKGAMGTEVNVLVPEIIGYSDYCAVHSHVQWFDAEGQPIALQDENGEEYFTQYYYYTMDIHMKTWDVQGVATEEEITEPVAYPTIVEPDFAGDEFVLETEEYQQEQVEGDGDAEALYMRIRLKYVDSGATKKLDKEVSLYLPYPDGLSYEMCTESHTFWIRHYLDNDHTTSEDIELVPTPYGLYGKVRSFSPFVLSWDEEESDDEDSSGDNTGSSSGSGNGSGSAGGSNVCPSYGEDEMEQTAAMGSYEVLCRKLNVRAGAGTEYKKIGSLRRGQVISGEKTDNGWIRSTLEDGIIGYVCASYVEEYKEAAPCEVCAGSVGSVVCRKLNVRNGAGTEYKRIGSLSRGGKVEIFGCSESHTWLKIKWNDETAWVCAKYIALAD